MTATNAYVAVSRRALDLEDYIDVARRHVGWIAGPLFGGTVLAVVIAFSLANSYESQATLQITPAQISETLVPATVNQQLTDRINQMQQEILSRQSLSSIIQDPRLKLYQSDLASKPLEDVIDNMRTRDIHFQITSLPGNAGRRASALTIRFEYPNRYLAKDTVQVLVTRFNDANQEAQRQFQKVSKDFVGDELTQAKANLDQLDEQLTKFRVQHDGTLPEQANTNLVALNSLMAEYGSVQEQLNRISQDRLRLDSTLSTLKSQLETMNTFALDIPSVSSPVARQNEELVALNREITAAESQMQQWLQQYREDYPDVRVAKKRIAVLTKRRDELVAAQEKEKKADAAKPKDAVKPATNYQLAQSENIVRGEISQTEAAIKINESQREIRTKDQDRLAKEVALARGRLQATSGIQAQYDDLKRDQANAAQKYQVLVGKQELTAQSADMIQRRAGENLEILDSPSLPSKPTKPNRWLIVGSGVALSFLVGLALAGVQEAKDTSLKNLKDVRAYTNLPVLSSIPLLENTLLVKRKKRLTLLAWAAAVIVGVLMMCGALFYYYSVTLKT